MGKKVKLTKIEEETRREQLQRGIKNGSLKSSVDKALNKVSSPIAAPFKNLLKKANVENAVAETAVESFVSSATLIGLAEIVAASGVLTEKVPGLKQFDKEKMDQFGRWLRGYAGDKLGTQTADGAFAVAPALASLISNTGINELLASAEDLVPVAQLSDGESHKEAKAASAAFDELLKGKSNGKNNS